MKRFSLTTSAILFLTLCYSQKAMTVGERITGDFNGDGKADTAFVKNTKTKTWRKNRTLSFSDKTIPSIKLGCCDVYLINEGDLNKDKATEISVFQAPENGCTYMWTTYTLKAHKWTELIPMFLVPTACDPFTEKDLAGKVFIENGKVYYWDIDINDNKSNPIKKSIQLKE